MEREVLIYQGGKTLVQRGGGCSILGNFQDQVGHGSEQALLVENVPGLPMTGELDQMAFKDCC